MTAKEKHKLMESLREFLSEWFFGGREEFEDYEIYEYFHFYSNNVVEVDTAKLLGDACSENYLSPDTPAHIDTKTIEKYFGVDIGELSEDDIEYFAKRYECEKEFINELEQIFQEHGYVKSPYPYMWRKKVE